jgi:molybdate transport system ATP-binding protein
MSLSLDITHDFPDFRLDVALRSGPGLTALFGPSGSGKTSILRTVAGLLNPDQGQIDIAGRRVFDTAKSLSISPQDRRIGYVFQDARLFPHLNVLANLNYGNRTGRDPSNIITLLGLELLTTRAPATLSGGEVQRVAIGRALLSSPDILLLDEPLSALDRARKDAVLPYLERLRDTLNIPMLYVSHDLGEVARLADTLVLLNAGSVLRAGPASELLSDPSLVPHLGRHDAGAVLRATLTAYDATDGLSTLTTNSGPIYLPGKQGEIGTELRLRVLAQDIILATSRPTGLSALNVLPVTVTSLHEGDGPGVAVGLSAGKDALLARVTRRSARQLDLRPGQSLFAILKATAVARRDVGHQPKSAPVEK